MDKKEWRKIQKELLKKKNVVAVGKGFRETAGVRTKDRAIICSVSRKESSLRLGKKDLIPYEVEGEITDVIETGEIKALKARTDRWRPAPGGVSIGHEWITAGTLGCLVKIGGLTYILSNNHVLADSNNAPLGSAILQPGKHDGGKLIDRIATLSKFVPIEFVGVPSDCKVGNAIANILNFFAGAGKRKSRMKVINSQQVDNLVDAAIALPTELTNVAEHILNIGAPVGFRNGALGMEIQKSGRTSGLTKGEILQVDVAVSVQYGEGKIALFVEQFMAGAMSAGGDSGSAVLDMEKHVVGLLFAGSEDSTVINPIGHVINLLDLDSDLIG